MRPATLLVVSSLLFGCVSPPQKPNPYVCTVDYPSDIAHCAYHDTPEVVTEEPLSNLDRAVSFKPAEWEHVQSYLHEMEAYIKRSCKR